MLHLVKVLNQLFTKDFKISGIVRYIVAKWIVYQSAGGNKQLGSRAYIVIYFRLILSSRRVQSVGGFRRIHSIIPVAVKAVRLQQL